MSTRKEQFIQGYWTGYDADENGLELVHLRSRQWRNSGLYRGAEDARSKVPPRVEWAWSDCISNLRANGCQEENLRGDVDCGEAPDRVDDTMFEASPMIMISLPKVAGDLIKFEECGDDDE
jgi:hypothetical protein